jgi:hypothetical protein
MKPALEIESRRLSAALMLALVGFFAVATVAAIGRNGHASEAALSPIDRLVAEDAIRQQIALYELLADGDGEQPKDIAALADRIMAPAIVNDVYYSNGDLKAHSVGRDPVKATRAAPSASPVAVKHFLVSTYFDEITPTTAKTRTTAMRVHVTKNLLGADCQKAGEDACGGRVTHLVLFIYHDSWTKTPDGWEKTQSRLRGDD